MANSSTKHCITRKANADLSAKQYYFVEGIAGGKADACNAITDLALGVLQNDPSAAGLPATIAILGTTKVVAGAANAELAKVAPTAAGKAQTAVSTQIPRGIALEAAGADGDIIEILLIDGGVPLV
jgi:hypothetical protein